MKSSMPGTDTLINSVTDINQFGFWVLCQNKEYFIAFNDYPVFKKHPVDDIFNVQHISPKQLYWPQLDVDIEIDALANPKRFPLFYN